jgi:serine/threonine protein kinase/Leucine-rich repeat (LRR) protein
MTPPSLTDDAALAELLRLWERQRAEGREPDLSQLCAQRPDLLPQLRQCVAQRQPQDQDANRAGETLGLPPQSPTQAATFSEGPHADALARVRQEISTAEGPVSALLLRWQEERDQGVTLSAEELCRDCPQHRQEVEQRLQRLHALYACLEQSAESSQSSGLRPAQQPDELGRLGPYRLLKVLGQGGMGMVYLAEDPKLKRQIALKVMLPLHAANDKARHRFLREAQAQAAIEHDHIISIFQVDEDNGVPFLAMPLLRGETLADALKREQKLPLPEVLRIGREIAEGLAAAHERHLIHRDIKPGNIWLEGKRRRVKILDFGLARAEAEGQQQHLTRTGNIVGTPAYMAPEQALGEPVDGRTDLFSLGCVLYQLATGELPFQGPTTMAVLTALAVKEPKPPGALNPEVPPELNELILHLMAKRPEARPPTALAVAEELSALEKMLSARSTPLAMPVSTPTADAVALLSEADPGTIIERPLRVGPRRRRRGPLMVFGILVLLVGVVVLAQQIIIRIRNENGTETKIEVPAKSTLIVEQSGQEVVRIPVEEKKAPAARPQERKLPTAPVGDADRAAAEWTLSIGGVVKLNGQQQEIKAAAELPRESFRLIEVKLKGNPQVSDAGLAYFKDCKNLSYVNLRETRVTDAGLAYFKDCKNLTELELAGTRVTGAGLAYFKDCKNLSNLVLDGAPVSDADLASFKDWKNLRKLSLSGTSVSDAGLAYFKGCENLIGLNLMSTSVSDAGLAYFQDCKNLTYIYLADTQVSDAGLAHFQDCKNLSYVNLRETRVTDAGLAYFKDCKNLTELNLNGTRVTGAGLAFFKDFKNLSGLELNGTPVSDAGLASFKDCKNLRKLYLSDTLVSDAGLAHFKDCKNLASLLLNGPRVSDAGLASFKDCKNLGHLVLGHTQVSDAGLAHFKDCKNLSYVTLDFTKVSDAGLVHFKDCKNLSFLKLSYTKVSDLSPLQGLPLTSLVCAGTLVKDLSPLKGIKNLSVLNLSGTKVSDLSPLKGLPLTSLACEKTLVKDLSPLRGMPLKELSCDFQPQRDAEILRSLKSLEKINGKPVAEFWKEMKGEKP